MTVDALESFFVAEGEAFRPTELCRGPWSADHAHGGPPAALIARAIEREMGAGMRVVRMTLEFLRPIPLGRKFALTSSVLRPGKKLRLLGASLFDGDLEIVRAAGLCLREQAMDPAAPPRADAPPPRPEDSEPFTFPFFAASVGYDKAMEARITGGRFGTGHLGAWMRMRVPLLPGEVPSPLMRVAIAADSGNGLSVALDLKRFTFLNPDLTIYLHRSPESDWVHLDATTWPEAHGVGIADTRLSDERGSIGRSVQSLLLQPRE